MKILILLVVIYLVLKFFNFDLKIRVVAERSVFESTYSPEELKNRDESYTSSNKIDLSESSAIFGQDVSSGDEISTTKSKLSVVDSSRGDSTNEFSQESGNISQEALPEGASLYLGDSTVLLEEVSKEDTEKSPDFSKNAINDNLSENGYNIISDGSINAASSPVGNDVSEYSDPVVMESFKAISKSDTDNSPLVSKSSPIDVNKINDLKESYKLMKKREEVLLEPSTEKIDSISASLKTPVTQSVNEKSELLEYSTNSNKNVESPSISPNLFDPNDDNIQIYVKSVDQPVKEVFGNLKHEAFENSQSVVGSESIFEETSESKLPVFTSNDENKNGKILSPNQVLSSQISDISEPIESTLSSLDTSYKSELLDISGTSKKREDKKEETSLSNNISNYLEAENLENSKNDSYEPLNKGSSTNNNEQEYNNGMLESSFQNPKTEDITIESSNEESRANESLLHESSKSGFSKSFSGSIEPPPPPSSAVEESTVGNQRIYSGPYIRTSATSGKVSPRIASVIKSLAEQFEKYNIYGAGGKSDGSVSNKYVNTIRGNFENKKMEPEFVPQNKMEEEWFNRIRNEKPKNMFLYTNRYEEMKAIQNTSGKSLFQEELEKMRGIYKNSLSQKFATGKVWERPKSNRVNKNVYNFGYSNDELALKLKEKSFQFENKPLTPNFNNELMTRNERNQNERDQNGGNQNEIDQNKGDISDKLELKQNEMSTEKISSTKDENSEQDTSFIFSSEKSNSNEDDSSVDSSNSDQSKSNLISEIKNVENYSQGSNDHTQISEKKMEFEDRKQKQNSVEYNEKNQRQKYSNDFVGMPFSYINDVKKLSSGWKSKDMHNLSPGNAILPQKELNEDSRPDLTNNQDKEVSSNAGDHKLDNSSTNNDEISASYSKDIELSPEQENEIKVCYSEAKKIKTINFRLEISEDPHSVTTETLINEFTRRKNKIRELVTFARETLRIAEKYNKKRSWRKKTKDFKFEFLELADEFLQYSEAIKSLLYDLIRVTNFNTMELLHYILNKHKHSKQELLVQCKILFQVVYSYKNSSRSKLMKRISNMYFLDVLNNQIKDLIIPNFQILKKMIESNKYLKKKLGKSIPDINQLIDHQQYSELSSTNEAESSNKNNKKENKFKRIFRKIFRRPNLKSPRKKKSSKKSRNGSKKK